MIMVINEISAHFLELRKSQKMKKPKTINNKTGKINPSNEISHHLSGCKNELQQARRNIAAAMIFKVIMNRLVNFRKVAMTGL
jgi:hypothetical protein